MANDDYDVRLITIVMTFGMLYLFLGALIVYNINGSSYYTVSSENGTDTENLTKIDTSPQIMDYIFTVFLLYVILAIILSAIFKKSEVLFHAMNTCIILWTLLIVYSSLGEVRGWFFWCEFPRTMVKVSEGKKVDGRSETLLSLMTYYLTIGACMLFVYLYVQQLRRGTPTSD